MEAIRFKATVVELRSDLSPEQLNAALVASNGASRDMPQFGVRLLLALCNKANGNNHRLWLDETKAAIARLGDRQNIPGNYNHVKPIVATSTKIYLTDEDKEFPKLWLEGVVWNKEITDERFDATMSAFRKGELGASWEIGTYRITAGEDDATIQDVRDYNLDGWCMTLDEPPAESATIGTVTLTAKLKPEGDGNTGHSVQQHGTQQYNVKSGRIVSSGIGASEVMRGFNSEHTIGFLDDIRCPVCDGTHGRLKRANFDKALFVMECGGYNKDDEKHEYAVEINVTARGANATYALLPLEGSQNSTKVMIMKPIKATKEDMDEFGNVDEMLNNAIQEVKTKMAEYSDEQIEEIRQEAARQAIADKEKAEADLKASNEAKAKEIEAAMQKVRDEEIPAAKKAAVDEYKASIALGATRVDELEKIMPFKSQEEKSAAVEEYAEMDEKDFALAKANLEIAFLKAQANKPKEGITATITSGLPQIDDEKGDKPGAAAPVDDVNVAEMMKKI